jgi:hypothetical protein
VCSYSSIDGVFCGNQIFVLKRGPTVPNPVKGGGDQEVGGKVCRVSYRESHSPCQSYQIGSAEAGALIKIVQQMRYREIAAACELY